MSAVKNIFGGGSKGSKNSEKKEIDMKTTSTSTQTPFTSDESKAAYNQFKNAAWDNYNNVLGYQPQMNNSINAMGDTIAKYQQ